MWGLALNFEATSLEAAGSHKFVKFSFEGTNASATSSGSEFQALTTCEILTICEKIVENITVFRYCFNKFPPMAAFRSLYSLLFVTFVLIVSRWVIYHTLSRGSILRLKFQGVCIQGVVNFPDWNFFRVKCFFELDALATAL